MQYRECFFRQGDDAERYMHVYDYHGAEALMNMLDDEQAWDDDKEPTKEQPWGESDRVEHKHEGSLHFVISANWRVGYIGVTEILYGV